MRRSTRWANWTRRALTLSLATMLATACQTTMTHTAVIDVRVVCQAFPAITYSSRDTPQTIREIVGFNAARDALCEKVT